jgi:hypothetical protein
MLNLKLDGVYGIVGLKKAMFQMIDSSPPAGLYLLISSNVNVGTQLRLYNPQIPYVA